MVGAEIQHITYREFLPAILGERLIDTFHLRPKANGYHMGYNDDRRFPDFSFIAQDEPLTEHLDCVIISHFHLDHCGALPYFTEMVRSHIFNFCTTVANLGIPSIRSATTVRST